MKTDLVEQGNASFCQNGHSSRRHSVVGTASTALKSGSKTWQKSLDGDRRLLSQGAREVVVTLIGRLAGALPMASRPLPTFLAALGWVTSMNHPIEQIPQPKPIYRLHEKSRPAPRLVFLVSTSTSPAADISIGHYEIVKWLKARPPCAHQSLLSSN